MPNPSICRIAILFTFMAPAVASAQGFHERNLKVASASQDSFCAGAFYGMSGQVEQPPYTGTLYKVNPRSGDEKLIATFDDTVIGIPICHARVIYGLTISGGVFALNPKTGSFHAAYDFDNDEPLTVFDYHGKLFGTTAYGGSGGTGFLFEIDPVTDQTSILYNFPVSATGIYVGNLTANADTIYGIASYGGTYGQGQIFAIHLSSGVGTVLYNFTQDEGYYPSGIIYYDGLLYGTLSNGGTSGHGTAYSFDPSSRKFTLLHNFGNRGDGRYPYGNLIPDNGLLFGITGSGGKFGYGTIYSIDPSTGLEKVMHDFSGKKEESPRADLVIKGATLVGVTDCCSESGYGTVYEYTP
jgi:uncharacterized repeat protein (TIGR03803 family)